MPTRGDRRRLEQIAWFGSALAEIGCAEGGVVDRSLLIEGAAFNLAVALFDTLVDERAPGVDELTRVLAPDVLARILRGNFDVAHSRVEQIERIAQLFRFVVGRAGQRFAGDAPKLLVLEHQLRRMFESEISAGVSRADAKTLPIEFVGELCSRSAAPSRLFESLGSFLALYDDWQDLGDDVAHGRANSFVRPFDRDGASFAYAASAALTLTAPSRVTSRLVAAERAVLDAAAHAGDITNAKTRRLLSWLFGLT